MSPASHHGHGQESVIRVKTDKNKELNIDYQCIPDSC